MNILIRNGTIKDIPQIKKCLIDSWVEHARQEPKLLDEERMRKSDIEGYYKKAFKNLDKCFVFIAEVNKKFAGFLRAGIQEIPDFFKNNKIFYFDDIYVMPKYRRKGIAAKLVQTAEKKAIELRVKRLQSRIYSFNKPIQYLLVKFGYRSPHAIWDKLLVC